MVQNIMTPIRLLKERSRRAMPHCVQSVVAMGLSLIGPVYFGLTLGGLVRFNLKKGSVGYNDSRTDYFKSSHGWRLHSAQVNYLLNSRARQLRDLLFSFTLHKFLRFSNAMFKLILVVSSLLVFLFWLVITSPIWITFLIWNIPTFIVLYLLVNYTSVGIT